jgi:putative ABC transport system permease protein
MLLLWLIIRASLNSLMANKMRSFLAMLGIIIGVWAVIAVVALGSGAQKKALDQIKSMGTNLLIVSPAQLSGQGVRGGRKTNLSVSDAAALRHVQGVALVTPAVGGSAQVKHLNQNAPTTVTGIAMTYLQIRDFQINTGRPFTENEAEGLARVALIGSATAQNLFANDDPLGEIIKVNGINFRVIGVLKSKGDQGWYNPDDQVFVPYTTAMRMLFGLRSLREIDVEAVDGIDLTDVQHGLANLLCQRHKITESNLDDFDIHNQAQMLEQVGNFTQIFRVLLAGIAGVSLLVGGIGIMNIMLVAVTERTREIGVRKAIGAKNRDIMKQFLIESALLTALGGSFGIALGFATSLVIGWLTPVVPIVDAVTVLTALGFSAVVGIFFGLYPAYRASRLDPIEALRYE